MKRVLQGDSDFFLPVLVGVIVYLAAMVAAAIFALSAQTGRDAAMNRLIVQLPSFNDTAANGQRLEVILPKLHALPGIAKVDLICLPSSPSPVLQQIVSSRSIVTASTPPIIAMELKAESGDAVPALRQRLLAELPESKITSGEELAAGALRSVCAIRGLMAVILGLLVATLCASVGFTMGARLKPTGEAVSLLHSLGADDATLVRVIVQNTVRSALLAAASGAASAMLTLVTFAGLAGGDFVASATDVLQSLAIWALITVLPVAAVSLVAISAWLFARRAFAAMP